MQQPQWVLLPYDDSRDREDLFQICATIWNGTDYIPAKIDSWLHTYSHFFGLYVIRSRELLDPSQEEAPVEKDKVIIIIDVSYLDRYILDPLLLIIIIINVLDRPYG